jgi:hypothetical protein
MTFGSRLAALLALFLPAPILSDAQHAPPLTDPEIATDRPDITESSIVVPKGSLQVENGLTWTAGHASQMLDASETLMRFGFLTRTEFRVVAPNYLAGFSKRDAVPGFGDIALGIKQQLGPLPGDFDLSVIAAFSLPTGADRVSSHGFDPFVKFPWSKELTKGWSIGGMQSLFWYTQDAGRNFTWEPTFYAEKEIIKRLSTFAEYGADFPNSGGAKHVAHFGTAYKITAKQQVDFHFGFGLSKAAPGQFFAAGYSFRIDRLSAR